MTHSGLGRRRRRGRAGRRPGGHGVGRLVHDVALLPKADPVHLHPAGGRPTHSPPKGPVKLGDRIEPAGDLYAGDHKRHGGKPVGSDHTICVFDAQTQPHCDAQAAIGGSMLFISSQGGDGDFTSWRSPAGPAGSPGPAAPC